MRLLSELKFNFTEETQSLNCWLKAHDQLYMQHIGRDWHTCNKWNILYSLSVDGANGNVLITIVLPLYPSLIVSNTVFLDLPPLQKILTLSKITTCTVLTNLHITKNFNQQWVDKIQEINKNSGTWRSQKIQ